MARSLEGRKFFYIQNNGVWAIVAEEILRNRGHIRLISTILEDELRKGGRTVPDGSFRAIQEGLAHIPQTPIFTFALDGRAAGSPWLTGSRHLSEALEAYIHAEDGELQGNGGFYVPFSNGSELGAHGADAMRNELQYVTTEAQFRDTFGIGPREVERWYAEKRQNAGVPKR